MTAPLDPKTGLTVVTMLSWSCLVKRFTNRCSFSANSHSSKAPAVKQRAAENESLRTGDMVTAAPKSAVYPSLRPQQHLCPTPIWHPQLQPQSARRLCRAPRWGLWRGRCRSREIPANTYRPGWRHQAAELHLHRCTGFKITPKQQNTKQCSREPGLTGFLLIQSILDLGGAQKCGKAR